jgi:hypothetical protein
MDTSARRSEQNSHGGAAPETERAEGMSTGEMNVSYLCYLVGWQLNRTFKLLLYIALQEPCLDSYALS